MMFKYLSKSAFDRTTLPAKIEKRLAKVDWSVKDVLVGSLGSREQFEDNIKRKYYYVPARNIEADKLAIRYIALYQSVNMFRDNAGIHYYAPVTETKLIQRKYIKFPMRRNNGEEWYYAFRVKEWIKLPWRISIKDEGVFEPKFTNLFLLEHCTQSYELFNIHSDVQYRLLYELKKMVSDASANAQAESIYQIGNGKTIRAHRGYFELVNENGESLFKSLIRISDFARHPSGYFEMIAGKINDGK